jgi:hypothetical protein
LNTTVAFVARDLPITLSDLIEANSLAILILINVKESPVSVWVVDRLTLTRRVFNIVDVALIISLCAQAGNTHRGSLELLTVEAL